MVRPGLLRHVVAAVVLVCGMVLVAAATRPALVHCALALVTGVAVYTVLLRWGVWHWLAGLASAPAVLHPLLQADGDDITAMVQPGVFLALVVLATLLLAWWVTPALASAALAGVLLGTATALLDSGWWVGLVAAGFLLLVAGTWRERAVQVLSLGGGFAVVVVAHRVSTSTGRWSTTRSLSEVGELSVPLVALLLSCLALGVVAALGAGRARRSGMQAVCALTSLSPAVVLLGSAGVGDPSWQGALLALVMWPMTGTLGLTALLRGRRGAAAVRPQADSHDVAALAAFGSRYSSPSLGPVVIVIAAYNEAAGLPEVLDHLPSKILGLHADIVVVDDGSTDGTADAVARHGRAYLVDPGVNRGQGAALRLGYRVAREHGARYVITTDADGQYHPDDLPVVLGPVLAGSADFVTGSRRLGGQETRDRVRRVGVHVFAWTVSALTGHWSTDTSFGLRAMRAELTANVTLNQPQYQSSELLIGALSHGWRVSEVPGRMRVRAAGASKKGRNLVYGTRYARVVWGTWFREGCPAPVTERAPALVDRLVAAPARSRGGRG